MGLRLFEAVDGAAHRLHAWHLIPDRLLGWLCNRFDLWLGVTPEELTETGGSPSVTPKARATPGRSIDEVIEERRRADPEFASDWDAQAFAQEFAITVIRFRATRGLSQEELARALWIEPHIVSHLEAT